MTKPKISVITPIYNSANYVDRFISNFNHANTNRIAELILIDDGSTDNTLSQVKSQIKGNNLISLFTQQHQFQSAARNLGMKYAKGEFYLFLDIDDTFDTNFFNIMLSNIKNNDLLICGIKRVLSDNTLVLNKSVLEGAKTKNEIAKLFLLDRDQMDSGLWNKLFKAEIVQENNLTFKNKNFVEDILFVFNYLMSIDPKKIGFIHTPLYTYYQNAGTTTTTYYSELDLLANSYVSQVKTCLLEHNINNADLLTINTAIRTEVYVIHRHILGDSQWNGRKQKVFLKQLISRFKNTKLLPYKYKLGLFLMKSFPSLYIQVYRQYKRIH